MPKSKEGVSVTPEESQVREAGRNPLQPLSEVHQGVIEMMDELAKVGQEASPELQSLYLASIGHLTKAAKGTDPFKLVTDAFASGGIEKKVQAGTLTITFGGEKQRLALPESIAPQPQAVAETSESDKVKSISITGFVEKHKISLFAVRARVYKAKKEGEIKAHGTGAATKYEERALEDLTKDLLGKGSGVEKASTKEVFKEEESGRITSAAEAVQRVIFEAEPLETAETSEDDKVEEASIREVAEEYGVGTHQLYYQIQKARKEGEEIKQHGKGLRAQYARGILEALAQEILNRNLVTPSEIAEQEGVDAGELKVRAWQAWLQGKIIGKDEGDMGNIRYRQWALTVLARELKEESNKADQT